jgi:DNA-binding transcriptional LysR family regulator
MDMVPFIMPSYNQDEDVRYLLEKYHVQPEIKAIAVDDPVVLSMVSYGIGVSILSGLVIAGNREDVSVIPLSPPSYRQIGMAANKNSQEQPHIKKLIKFIKNNPHLTPVYYQ